MTVTADAYNINTTDATVSTVVDRNFAENLPMNGRSFQTLIMLTPGVVLTPASEFGEQGQFSVNGQRADANYFTVDGVSANVGVGAYPLLQQSGGGALPVLSAQGGTNSLVSVDAMQEFRVQTSSLAPEFGRSPGGQVSIATRSGTNQFHGTAFDYFRNDVLDANDWFSDHHGLPKSEERQNDFGGVFGGPIIRDKTIFFFSYEGLRLRQPLSQETVVPDLASRQQAPSGIQPFLNAFPLPNGVDLGGGTAQFNSSYSNPSSLDAYSIRLDHTINSANTLFARYNYSPSDTSTRGALGTPYAELSNIGETPFASHTFTIGEIASISPKLTHEFRANYSNTRATSKYLMDGFGGAVAPPGSLFPPGFSAANAEFAFWIIGVGAISTGTAGTTEQRQVNLVDNFSLASANHQLKFGVDYRWLSPLSADGNYYQAPFFSGMTGPGGALSGVPIAVAVDAFQSAALLSKNISLYGQDTWQLTSRFTLTYGLRWDVNPPLTGKNGDSEPFTVQGLSDPSTMTLAPLGTPLYATRYGNIAPRIGVAYRINEAPRSVVLRGGWGIFYDLGSGSLGNVASYFPFGVNTTLSNVNFPLTPQEAAPPPFSLNPPVSQIYVAVPNLKLPRTYQFNVALEKALSTNQTASLTYVGAVGRDLLRQDAIYFPSANFGYVAHEKYSYLQLRCPSIQVPAAAL